MPKKQTSTYSKRIVTPCYITAIEPIPGVYPSMNLEPHRIYAAERIYIKHKNQRPISFYFVDIGDKYPLVVRRSECYETNPPAETAICIRKS